MPIPPSLRSAARHRPFWADFFGEIEDEGPVGGARPYPNPAPCRAEFPVGGGHGLALEWDEYFDTFNLWLAGPALPEPVLVGWDDPAHWHPHVLRWDELDRIGRAVALADPDLPHPGLAVLLLGRFAPICSEDDAALAVPMLEEAWSGTGLFTAWEIEGQVHRIDRRLAGFQWRPREPRGWFLDQTEEAVRRSRVELYTLRDSGNEDFPFEEWDRMIEAASRTSLDPLRAGWLAANGGAVAEIARGMAESGELNALGALSDALEEAGCDHPMILAACREPGRPARACWVVEYLAGAEPGSALFRHFGPMARPSKTDYLFAIEVTTREGDFVADPALVRELARAIHLALAAESIGGASITGGRGGERETLEITARVVEERERGLRILRDAVAATPIPDRIWMTQVSPDRQPIPLPPSPWLEAGAGFRS